MCGVEQRHGVTGQPLMKGTAPTEGVPETAAARGSASLGARAHTAMFPSIPELKRIRVERVSVLQLGLSGRRGGARGRAETGARAQGGPPMMF